MEITHTTTEQCTVVQIQGNLDTNTAPEAQAHIDALIEGGVTAVLLDFSTMNYISSAGLRVLLVTSKKLRPTGGKLHMYGLNETAQEVFDMSGFSTILSVFANEADALAAL